MAKYDWKQLEKEFILSEYKSVSSFLRFKEIKNNGTTRKYTAGWKDKKRQKEDKKATKTIEKTIEKESEKEAQQRVDVKSIANDLALNIIKANKELHIHTDMFGGQHEGIIDAGRLKKLTSALKDIEEIINKDTNNNNDDDKVQIINDLPKDGEYEKC